jgi:ubiquinone/menaquinone biosynthesis C-methylase UbiE
MKDFCVKKTWSQIYASPINVEQFLENICIHKDFIGEILNSRPERIIEVGCGSASLSIFLSHFKCSVTAVDNIDEILDNAKISSDSFNGKVLFKKADAFNLPFENNSFDIAFSQGVIEHFSNVDIFKFLKEQLRVAEKVIFSVPSRFYNHLDFGNERLLTKKQWERILSNFKIELSRYYYRIPTKRNFMLSLPLMYMAKIQ